MSTKVRNACRKLRLPAPQKFALVAMADYARHDGTNVFPTLKTLEEETGFSESTLRRAITALEERALLVPERKNRGGRLLSNLYRIDLARVAELTAGQAGNPVTVTALEPAANPVTVTALEAVGNPVTVTLNPVTVTALEPEPMVEILPPEELNPVTLTENPVTLTGESSLNKKERESQATLICPNEPRHGSRQWSPKIDDPNQFDLIDDTALFADYQPVNPEPVGELEPELPLGLSLAGEVMPPAAPVPEVLPPEGVGAAAGEVEATAPTGGNVVAITTAGRRTKPTGDAGFDEFYAAYPRHEDRTDALKAYRAALKRPGVTHAVLMQGVAWYRADLERNPRETQFIKLPATWLNKGSYGNKPSEAANHGQRGESGNRRHGGLSAEQLRETRQRGVTDGILRRLESRRAAPH